MRLSGVEMMEGDRLPRFYGISYWSEESDHAICHPFPFNIAIGYLRKWWLAVRYHWAGKGRAREPVARYTESDMSKARSEERLIAYNELRHLAGMEPVEKMDQLPKEKRP